MAKKRVNIQDATLKNTRVIKRSMAALEKRVTAIETRQMKFAMRLQRVEER